MRSFTIIRRNPMEVSSSPSCYYSTAPAHAADMDDFAHQHHFHHSPLLGSGSSDYDAESWHFHRDPEVESVRSHPSSHHTADQSLLPTTVAPPRPRPQPQRLQRRRNYHYMNGVLVPTSPTDFRSNQQQLLISRSETTGSTLPSSFDLHRSDDPNTNPSQSSSAHKRSKSYSASGLLGSASAFVAESKRASWTGERREIRKLQKEHPAGSARPNCSVEINGDDDDDDQRSGEGGIRRSSSVRGVKRRMERLRGLYRKGDKEEAAAAAAAGWTGRG